MIGVIYSLLEAADATPYYEPPHWREGIGVGRWTGGSKIADAYDLTSFPFLLSRLREDLVANGRHWTSAGFHAIAVYRFGVWARHQKGLAGRIVTLLYRVLNAFVRNLYSVELPHRATIGHRPRFPHPAGVVISQLAEVGDDCMIRQNVTIGSVTGGRKRTPPYAPKLGNGVEVGAGAVIIGGITIGDGARIGPNAVVMTDVPPGGTAFASPAKVMEPLRKTKAKDEDVAVTEPGDR